jgi:hypothetical protein
VSSFAGAENESEFAPIPDFQRSEADVTLLFLTRPLVYTERVNDVWFNASVPFPVDGWSGPKWVSPVAASVMGCTEQYQFCRRQHCTPLSGLYAGNEEQARAAGFNPPQLATFRVLWKAAWATQMRYSLVILGSDVLLAKRKVYTGFHLLSQGLPENQWQTEVENIHNISMALLQRRVVDHVLPSEVGRPDDAGLEGWDFNKENDTESQVLCSRQRIRSSEFTSFCVLGIAIIVAVGSLVALIDLVLADAVGWIQHRIGRGLSKRFEWIEHGTLNLQRLLFEAWGIGPWKGDGSNLPPVTDTFGHEFQPPDPMTILPSPITRSTTGFGTPKVSKLVSVKPGRQTDDEGN